MKDYNINICFGQQLAKSTIDLPAPCKKDDKAPFGWAINDSTVELFGVVTISDGEKLVDGIIMSTDGEVRFFNMLGLADIYPSDCMDPDVLFLDRVRRDARPLLEAAYREWKGEKKVVIVEEMRDDSGLGICTKALMVENYDSQFCSAYNCAVEEYKRLNSPNYSLDYFLYTKLCWDLGYRYEYISFDRVVE